MDLLSSCVCVLYVCVHCMYMCVRGLLSSCARLHRPTPDECDADVPKEMVFGVVAGLRRAWTTHTSSSLIGNDDRTFEESDVPNVPYLQAFIKETLRLHPPVTFLVPHKAITEVEIKGHMVPKDAQIMCNMWAMGQDPFVWSDPQRFEPERKKDVLGLPLADIMLHLMLGTLIHKFDRKIEGGMRTQDMYMTDKFGFTLKKNLPLMAIPIKLRLFNWVDAISTRNMIHMILRL
ncbi:putative cytochrome P450 [Helianthus anomalus]